MTKREELVALADRLASGQMYLSDNLRRGDTFVFQMTREQRDLIVAALRASAAPPEREAATPSLVIAKIEEARDLFWDIKGDFSDPRTECRQGADLLEEVIALLSSRDDGEAKSSDGERPSYETRGGAGDDCSVGKRGAWPPEGSDGIAVGERGPESCVTGGESAATIPADVLAMKEACKRAADDLSNEYFAKSRELMHKEGEGRAKAASDACDEVSAAISRIDVPAKADAGEIDVPGKTAGESDLRSANIARQKEWDAGNQITLAYRGNELAGEVGEACNVIKKLERERMGIRGSRDTFEHLAEEMADVVICADLIAMQAGIDLDKAVRDKFNATSEKMNLKTRLAALHSTSAAGETTSSDGGGRMADFSSGDPNNLKELMAGPSVFDPPSEAADVLAMKEACKRAVSECLNQYGRMTFVTEKGWSGLEGQIRAAIDKLSPEVKAEGGRVEPVEIKPLRWRDHRPDSFPEPAWSAQTPFGFYNIEEVSASDSPRYVVRLHAHHFVADKDSLDEAKEAAQADYEQRIRSALDVHPVSPPDVEAIRADERERCALVAERYADLYDVVSFSSDVDEQVAATRSKEQTATAIASAIRTGGQK